MQELIDTIEAFGENAAQGSALALEASKIKKTRVAFWYSTLSLIEATLRIFDPAREHANRALEMIDQPWPKKKNYGKELFSSLVTHAYYFLRTRGGRHAMRGRIYPLDPEKEIALKNALTSLHQMSSWDSNFPEEDRVLLHIKNMNVAIKLSISDPVRWGFGCFQMAFGLMWNTPRLANTYLNLGIEVTRKVGEEMHEYIMKEAEEAINLKISSYSSQDHTGLIGRVKHSLFSKLQ
ncbi:hypothetical protein HDU67_009439 [Dinochytrium kinnereticum]|nr:hypothetical protein HDU67_009439 [Dinochytrium kinnereticum]